jgi:hypothetical protein
MSLEVDRLEADERETLLDALAHANARLLTLECENARLRRCLDAVSACHVCDLCAESARLTLDLVTP